MSKVDIHERGVLVTRGHTKSGEDGYDAKNPILRESLTVLPHFVSLITSSPLNVLDIYPQDDTSISERMAELRI